MYWLRNLFETAEYYFTELTWTLYSFLTEIGADNILLVFAMGLMALFCLSTLINVLLTTIASRNYGPKQRHILRATARKTYWSGIFIQLLAWLFMADRVLIALQTFDFCAAVACAALVVLTFLFAIVTMLLPRKGKRVYIAKMLARLAGSTLLMGLFTLVFGWLLF